MKIISILYHREEEGWWADSSDLPGWTAAADSLEELRPLALEGAREFAGPEAMFREAVVHDPLTLTSAGSASASAVVLNLDLGVTMSYAVVREEPVKSKPVREVRTVDRPMFEILQSAPGCA